MAPKNGLYTNTRTPPYSACPFGTRSRTCLIQPREYLLSAVPGRRSAPWTSETYARSMHSTVRPNRERARSSAPNAVSQAAHRMAHLPFGGSKGSNVRRLADAPPFAYLVHRSSCVDMFVLPNVNKKAHTHTHRTDQPLLLVLRQSARTASLAPNATASPNVKPIASVRINELLIRTI